MDESAVHEFLVSSASFYDDKQKRQDAITPILNTLLRRGIEDRRNPDGTGADGNILYCTAKEGIHGSTTLLFFELNNEIGAGDSDAVLRAGLVFRKHWSQYAVFPPSYSSVIAQ